MKNRRKNILKLSRHLLNQPHKNRARRTQPGFEVEIAGRRKAGSFSLLVPEVIGIDHQPDLAFL
jgi:hypothetical protein